MYQVNPHFIEAESTVALAYVLTTVVTMGATSVKI